MVAAILYVVQQATVSAERLIAFYTVGTILLIGIVIISYPSVRDQQKRHKNPALK